MEQPFDTPQKIGIKMPKIMKKQLLIFWGIITITLIGFIGYQFGWLKIKADIYQKGIEAGKLEINNLIIQNLIQFGQIRINIPVDVNGDGQIGNDEIRTIILIPQVQQ